MKIFLNDIEIINYLKKSFKPGKIDVYYPQNHENFIKFTDILKNKVFDLDTWLINIPYCVIRNNHYSQIFFEKRFQGEKIKQCGICKYNNICGGFPKKYFTFFGKQEVAPIANRPTEIMIEIESACNFKCLFCFSKSSLSKQLKKINYIQAKKMIDSIAEFKVELIRLTGGEPLLNNDLFKIAKYAKEKNLSVGLNTNASLINQKNIKDFQNIFDNILISIESHSDSEESKITGFPNALNKKITAVKLLKSINIPQIRIGTVASSAMIKNFGKLFKLVVDLDPSEWEIFRPITNRENANILNKFEIEKLMNLIIKHRKKAKFNISIANAIPLCSSSNHGLLNRITKGSFFDDGHERMVVDPEGNIKTSYYDAHKIAKMPNLRSAWQSSLMKKIRNLELLPNACEECRYKYKCRGGNRHEVTQDRGLDILANPKNIKI